MATDKITATTMRAMVSMALSHRPTSPTAVSDPTANAPSRQPTFRQESSAMPKTTVGHGSQRSASSKSSRNVNTASATVSNTGAPVRVSQRRKSLISFAISGPQLAGKGTPTPQNAATMAVDAARDRRPRRRTVMWLIRPKTTFIRPDRDESLVFSSC